MNLCRSSNLTEKEAYANLYFLSPTGSQAGRFYYKHVLTRARSLDEAFKMLYSRFMPNERRDRLLYQWNNFNFAEFMKKSGATKQSALCQLCSTASCIDLQLGASYQDPQHLREDPLTACKNEKWAHRLAKMPNNDLLDFEESLARAITPQDNLDRFMRNVMAAYGNEVNFNDGDVNTINFTRDRLGMPYRRYESDRRFDKLKDTTRVPTKPSDEKNPNRNFCRILCRMCLSDSHLLRDCPKITPAKHVQIVRHVFAVDAVPADRDECCNSLDTIQEFNDERWNECCVVIESDQEKHDLPNSVNYATFDENNSPLPDHHFDRTVKELAN